MRIIGILAAGIVIGFSSCASLYTPAQEPTPFMEKKDGIAASGSATFNNSVASLQVGATKAIKNDLSVNASGSLGVAGYYYAPLNPFKNSKTQTSLAANIGWNTRKVTNYPLQLWFGLQGGRSSDSYDLAYYETPRGSNVQWQTKDSIRFEKLSGSYVGARFGLTMVYLSNYSNDINTREKKKHIVDLIGNHIVIPMRYFYSNQTPSIPDGRGLFLGYGLNLRYMNKKYIFSLSNQFLGQAQPIFEQLGKYKNNPRPAFTEYAVVNPALNFTLFLH